MNDPKTRNLLAAKRKLLIDGKWLMPNPARPFQFTIQPAAK
jgi:hypothetical protein